MCAQEDEATAFEMAVVLPSNIELDFSTAALELVASGWRLAEVDRLFDLVVAKARELRG
jgi:hypothetical protein